MHWSNSKNILTSWNDEMSDLVKISCEKHLIDKETNLLQENRL